MEKEESKIGGRYICIKPLGKGGSGSVFLCYDTKLCKNWAVKCMQDTEGSSDNPGETKESLRPERMSELEALKTVSYSVFPRIVDVIRENGNIYMVMDYVEGITLKERMMRGKLTEKEIIPWALEIAKALRYLHQMSPQVLYLDCKPENIMLTKEGEIRLVDLGSAYLCQAGYKQRLSGTNFFAPEELRFRTAGKKEPDVRTDIYIFGMTLYVLLAGKKKEYRRNGRLSVRDVNPGVSYGMNAIIAKCTEKDAAKRYKSMDEVLHQLTHIKEVGKREREKRSFMKLGEWIVKSMFALCCLLSSRYSVIQKQPNIMVWSILLLLVLFALCKPKRSVMYEVKQDLFCGSGKRFLGLLLLCMGFLAGGHLTSYAAQTSDRNCLENALPITIYDSEWRKLLIREGASWGVEQDIFLSIPFEQISETGGEITIFYTDEYNGTTRKYSFKCHRK